MPLGIMKILLLMSYYSVVLLVHSVVFLVNICFLKDIILHLFLSSMSNCNIRKSNKNGTFNIDWDLDFLYFCEI